jgi:hypothetical protein
LRVVNDNHISTACRPSSQGSSLLGPVAVGVLLAPFIEYADMISFQCLACVFDALKNVVVVLRDTKYLGLRSWNIPVDELVSPVLLQD